MLNVIFLLSVAIKIIIGGVNSVMSGCCRHFAFLIVVFGCFSITTMADDNVATEFHRFWPDNLFAVEFVTDDVGYIAGYSGTVLRTLDGGDTWDAVYIGRNELIRRLSFVDETTGWAVGHRGSIFHTDDAGLTWSVQKEIPGVYLRDIDFSDHDNGWVVGHDANIWNTNDGGRTWRQQHLLGYRGRDIPRLHGIYAMDRDSAILVGEFGVVAHTENGGNYWLITPVKSKITWLAVDGADDMAYVVGLDGEILRLSIATEAQRKEIDRQAAAEAAKAEAKARARAKRRKQQYVKKETADLPRSDIEYFAEPIASGSGEHLFDITVTSSNEAVVVGRSAMLKIAGDTTAFLKPDDEFPLPFIWMGGVAVTSSGHIWAPGIRGLVAAGDLNKMTFGQAFNLATTDDVKLLSSRWSMQP